MDENKEKMNEDNNKEGQKESSSKNENERRRIHKMKIETLLKTLKERLGQVEGLEEESLKHKIKVIESRIEGIFDEYTVTTTKIVNKEKIEHKIEKEKNLEMGYKKIIKSDRRLREELEEKIDFINLKLMILKREMGYLDQKYNNQSYEFLKTTGSVIFEVVVCEIDPIFDVKNVQFFVDMKLVEKMTLKPQAKAEIPLEKNSELEIFLMGEDDMVIGMMFLPCEFFINKEGNILDFDFRLFNYIKARVSFAREIKLIRNNAEIMCTYKEGHGLENYYNYTLKYCSVCNESISMFSYNHRCFRCKFLCHKKCTNFILFKCKRCPVNIEIAKPKKEYNISHELVKGSSSGFRYCDHCGCRITTENDHYQCKKCSQRFHLDCRPFLFDSCGIDLELRTAMAEFNPPPLESKDESKIRIEDFSLLKVLGRGSFGKVMLSKHIKTGEVVALKILKKEKIVNTNDLFYIEIERRVLSLVSTFKHPFLMRMLFCFQDESNLFFGTEYLPGGDLFHHALEQNFDDEQIRLFACEILLGLEFLHTKYVIYRDMKLDNIMLTSDGHIKIVDFGLCKENIGPFATTFTYCGTPDTIAPEVIKGEGYTNMVDWWSYGVVLFELYEKQPPFSGITNKDISYSIINKDPVFTSSLPMVAKDFILQLLNKDPSKRLGGENIKGHDYFKDVVWQDVYDLKIKPKFVPGDSSKNFDEEFTGEPVLITPSASINAKYEEFFTNFK